ncbi:hypothetical protein H5410_032803 [Solanum commersonii]|uniref:Uncharacterized protein n=1 Tax=Solanum commersonii TaxID=4109 RepID=A0A9J5YM17_SOLCO|nr:hypothetical protein H5410_032803 [Solanum commersonii]
MDLLVQISRGINFPRWVYQEPWYFMFFSLEMYYECSAGSDLEVMVVIPNDQLSAMNYYDRAKDWVKHNVTRYN